MLALARYACPGEMEPHFGLCAQGQLSHQLTEAGAQLHWLRDARLRNPLAVHAARRSLGKLLDRELFDVVVTHSSWSQTIFGPVVRARRLPLVTYMHAPAGGRHWLERCARLTPPDLVICNSRFTASTVANIYPSSRFEVVLPVLPPAVSTTVDERSLVRREFKTAQCAVVIIQVGRLESGKGHRLLLRALSLLPSRDWICWQIGGPQTAHEVRYLNSLKAAVDVAGLNGRVLFLGQRKDVPRLLSAADIYCQPNVFPEGFGLTFAEALRAGVPVITTDQGGAREIIDDSCGALVPPDDPAALAAKLQELIDDPNLRRQLGDCGRKRAREFSDPSIQLLTLRRALQNVSLNGTNHKSVMRSQSAGF